MHVLWINTAMTIHVYLLRSAVKWLIMKIVDYDHDTDKIDTTRPDRTVVGTYM